MSAELEEAPKALLLKDEGAPGAKGAPWQAMKGRLGVAEGAPKAPFKDAIQRCL